MNMAEVELILRAQSKARERGRKGGHAQVVANGPYAAPRRARAGKITKYEKEALAEAEARGETLRPADLAAIVEHKKWIQLANARAALAEKRALNKRIRDIANPPAACVYCYAEREAAFPAGHTTKICRRHQKQLANDLAASRVYGAA